MLCVNYHYRVVIDGWVVVFTTAKLVHIVPRPSSMYQMQGLRHTVDWGQVYSNCAKRRF